MSTRYTFCNACLTEHRQHCDCTVCVEAWEVWHEVKRYEDQLAPAAAEVRQAKPATEAEWAAFFDAEFPRAGGGS